MPGGQAILTLPYCRTRSWSAKVPIRSPILVPSLRRAVPIPFCPTSKRERHRHLLRQLLRHLLRHPQHREDETGRQVLLRKGEEVPLPPPPPPPPPVHRDAKHASLRHHLSARCSVRRLSLTLSHTHSLSLQATPIPTPTPTPTTYILPYSFLLHFAGGELDRPGRAHWGSFS